MNKIELAKEIQALSGHQMSSTVIEARAWRLAQMVINEDKNTVKLPPGNLLEHVAEEARQEQREKDALISECYPGNTGEFIAEKIREYSKR